MDQDTSIRTARANDLALVISLTDDAFSPYTLQFGASPIPVTEDYVPRIARDEVSILEIDGEAAGILVLERHADHAEIFSIAVAPRFQHKGLGIVLLDWAEKQVGLWGLPEIRLYTNAMMERNISFYLAYGFHETGRRPNPYREGWICVDMAKAIEPNIHA